MNSLIKTVGFGVFLLTSGALLADQSAPPATNTQTPTPAASAEAPLPVLSQADLIYHILVAEVAARRGQIETALQNYRIAALSSNDPRVAERATGVALYAGNNEATLELARRWQALDGNSLQARQSLALALLRDHQLDAAVEMLEAVRIAAQQDGQQGFATLSNLLGQVRDRETVFRVMEVLRGRHPQSTYALYYYALGAAGLEKYDQALNGLNAALALNGKWREAHLLRARVLLQKGDKDKAMSQLAEAVNAQPDDLELRLGYARLLVAAERLDDARAQFQILAERNPNDGESLYALGLLAAEANQLDQAESYLKKVIDLGKRAMDAYFELGKIEEKRGNFQKAQDWYVQVSEGERYLNAQVRAAAMSARQGDFPGMSARLAQLREDSPDDAVSLYIAEADILRDEKRYQQAFDRLSQALSNNPGNKELLYARALSAEKIDRLDVLEEDLLALIKADPDNGHALNALGYTLADRTQRYAEALQYLERAIALLPNDAAVLDSMGWIKYRLGNYQESLNFMRRAFEVSQDPEIVSHLTEVLWVSGQKDEARQVWKKAIEKEPKNDFLLKLKERFAFE